MIEPDTLPPTLTRREFLKLLGAGAGLAFFGGALSACAPSLAPTAVPTAASTIAVATPAQVSGKLAIYSALAKNIGDPIVAAFKSILPEVNVSVSFSAAGDVQKKVIGEKAKPKADVLLGGESSFHDGLAREGLLEKYVPPNAEKIANAFRDPQGFWTGWSIAVFSFALNADRFAKEMAGAKMPTTWDDLLDPAWKGKLVLPDPMRNVSGYVFLVTQVFRFQRDEDRTMEYMKKLHANIAQYVRTAPEGIKLVAQGKTVGCPGWRYEILTEKAKGTPIELVTPENSSYEIGAVSIVKGAPNAAGARAFVDWLITQDAGELMVKLSNRVSVLSEVAPPPGALTLEQMKLVDYDRHWAADNKDRLLKKWQKAMR